MKIEKIDKSRLRNDEHFQLHKEFRDLVVRENHRPAGEHETTEVEDA